MAEPLKGSDEDMSSYKTRLVCSHIRNCLSQHRSGKKPLIVGVQGPQGSGKTTLTTGLVKSLAQQSIKVAVFSIDDLYLPFAGLEEVAQRNAGNVLLAGRGQPGTHDVELGSKILRELSGINDGSGSTVSLPIFDKSQNGGKGDRSADSVPVSSPIDVVVFEGWCLGFASLQPNALRQRYKAGAQGDTRCYFSSHALSHLETINANLAQLERAWYPYLDAFVQLVPQTIETVFEWRLEAEHAMKAKNGGKGMTDEEVRGFVERYMPGYELFAEGVTQEDAPWKGRLLRIGLDERRDVTFVES
ncbi:P-loop containing nucleoside triphosphate hydrolase protein [Jaminaea rosea]|uniref:P-loop containing nucleoside triphosphate hydrolase protein n=1 Tax=Jaminaea rosea TaxID=1569628 RepID=A0A316UZF4_9BASI|nr:P-loop containing nucleoside triphosphate hydrolase protein [Jaminaea rosea]PWN30687.1 P-loop containing nucleoside triphosphate hydrolase protein [Jaminaea rosea]